MTIIDSTGETYKAAKATQMGGEGPLWGFSLIYSRRVRVELTLNHLQKMTLADVKRAVCNGMRRDPHIWEAALYEDGVRGWQEKVQDGKTIAEIIELLRSNQ